MDNEAKGCSKGCLDSCIGALAKLALTVPAYIAGAAGLYALTRSMDTAPEGSIADFVRFSSNIWLVLAGISIFFPMYNPLRSLKILKNKYQLHGEVLSMI